MKPKQLDIFEEPISTPQATGRASSGKARMNKLTKEERSNLASHAATQRWSGPRAVGSITDIAELRLAEGMVSLPCAVLADGTRVLTEKGFLAALGRTGRPRRAIMDESGLTKSPPFLEAENLRQFITKELREASVPIPFQTALGFKAWGYRAELLPQVCELYLKAKDKGVLIPVQYPIADACAILIRGLAQVGIIALVDEATGYQNDRTRDALAQILRAFIARELQPYVKTFPTDYYSNMFRLRGLNYPADPVRRPQYFGVLTNDIVYSRLAPGVLTELRKVVPRNQDGRPTAKYFRMLTSNIGYPKLREHLGAVVALMKVSATYSEFHARLNEHYPQHGQLVLPYEPAQDSGLGF